MTVRRRFALVALTVALALAVPGMAHAASRTVRAGPPPASARPFEAVQADVNDFFPHRVAIHVGDSLRFVTAAFHTVDLPPARGAIVPLIIPSTQTVGGITDAAGQTFAFNGQPQQVINPGLLTPAWGQRATYSGTARVDSGLPPPPAPKPFAVRFDKTGRFTFLCDVHPGMEGVVDVLPKRAALPSRRARARSLAAQVARALKVAKRLRPTGAGNGVVDLGLAGRSGVERFAMFPATTNVRLGQPVTFRMTKRSFEAHTATFGPGPATSASTYVGTLSASFRNPTAPLDPRAVYPSDPGSALASITPTSHGNGFWSSGVLDTDKASPVPASSRVSFGAPGTYDFYCLIHPQMHGVVKVT